MILKLTIKPLLESCLFTLEKQDVREMNAKKCSSLMETFSQKYDTALFIVFVFVVVVIVVVPVNLHWIILSNQRRKAAFLNNITVLM